MTNKIRKWLTACILIATAVFVTACEKDFSDQDNDLIAGKWRDTGILNTPGLNEEAYMTYMEFAPYNYLLAKRRINYVSFIIDTTQDIPLLRFEKHGRYTLNGDSLIVKDSMDRTVNYIIQYIRNDTLCYKDKKDSLYIYTRYNSELEEKFKTK